MCGAVTCDYTFMSNHVIVDSYAIEASSRHSNLGHSWMKCRLGISKTKFIEFEMYMECLSINRISARCTGAVALAEYIAETNKLLRLDLRGNHIRTGGLMALTLSLKVNQTVTRLDLDQEPKKEAVSCVVDPEIFFSSAYH